MNKLAYNLALQAGMKHPVMGQISYNCFSHEEFAKLVAKECIKIIESHKSPDCKNQSSQVFKDICASIKDRFK